MKRSCFFLSVVNGVTNVEWADSHQRLDELDDGVNYLGGQRLNVTREDDVVWVNQLGGPIFTGDPGTYCSGFEEGLKRLRRLAAKIVMTKPCPAIEFVPYPVFAFITQAPCHEQPGLFNRYGKDWHNLRSCYVSNRPGVYTHRLPNLQGFTLEVTLGTVQDALCLSVVPQGGVVLSNHRHFDSAMKVFEAATFPLDGFTGLNEAQGTTLYDLKLFQGVPRHVIKQSLLI